MYLHIYTSHESHGDAYIAGDTESLKQLRDAIDKALNDESSSFYAFAGDDEEYLTLVVRTENVPQLIMPYSGTVTIAWDWTVTGCDENGWATYNAGRSPYSLLTKDQYKELCKK